MYSKANNFFNFNRNEMKTLKAENKTRKITIDCSKNQRPSDQTTDKFSFQQEN